MTSWSPIQPESVWSKVAIVLRKELGEGPYNSYVAPSSVRPGPFGDPVLVTPTAYARDWISRNAIRRAQELWALHDPESRVLDVKCRVEYEDENRLGSDARIETPAVTKPLSGSEAISTPESEPVAESQPVVVSNANRISGLQERLTFDSFVAGRGNEFAYTMSRQVASWADGHFNPVFFHGPYGYGKTHLLNAIGWEAQMPVRTPRSFI